MLFRNALRLLMENFKNVYKILLYQILVSVIAAALWCALILPEINALMDHAVTRELLAQAQEMFSCFFAANGEGLAIAKDRIFGADGLLTGLLELVASKATSLVLTLIGCIAVYLVKRFAETLCYCSIGNILNDRMSTYAETSFSASFASSLGKASRYALVYVPSVFIFDVITIGMVLALFMLTGLLPSLFFSVLIVVLMQSLKLSATGRWMPAILNGATLREAIRGGDAVEKRVRWRIYTTYVVTVYLIIIVNAVAAICTLGSGLLITVPASFLLLICMQFGNYYTVRGKKYFLTYDKIAYAPDRGDREHFFEYIDQTAPHSTARVDAEEEENEKEVTEESNGL